MRVGGRVVIAADSDDSTQPLTHSPFRSARLTLRILMTIVALARPTRGVQLVMLFVSSLGRWLG